MKKILKRILIWFLILIPLVSVYTIKADSGWDSSYGSSSHSSSSSSSRSSSRSSSKSSSRSTSRTSTYHSSSSSSNNHSVLYFVIGLIYSIFMFIFFIGIIISIIGKGRRKINVSSYKYKDISESELKAILPNLTLKYLKDITYQRFIDIQMAWMNFDYDKLRELCTDELYNAYISQLDTLKLKNGQNVMSDFNLQQINIIGIKEEDGKVAISVYMRVKFKDYVINQKTKKVIRGNSSTYMTNNYIMTFVRGKDAINSDISCPNCGARVSDTASSKCEYCGSDIVKDSSEFVLSKKTNINK